MGRDIFIIAEIGINHNGNLGIARDLIDVAVAAGADAVKFQKRTIDLVYTQEFLDGTRESPWGTTQREQKEGLGTSGPDVMTSGDEAAKIVNQSSPEDLFGDQSANWANLAFAPSKR